VDIEFFTQANVRFGSKADMGLRPLMSAIHPKADIAQRDWNVRFVPIPDISLPIR
jgi:hypothetical protein